MSGYTALPLINQLATVAGWTLQSDVAARPHFEILESVPDGGSTGGTTRPKEIKTAAEGVVESGSDGDNTDRRTTTDTSNTRTRSTTARRAHDWSISSSSTTSSTESSRAMTTLADSLTLSPSSGQCYTPSLGESHYVERRSDEKRSKERSFANNHPTLPRPALCQVEPSRRGKGIVRLMRQGVRRVLSFGVLSARREPMEEAKFDTPHSILDKVQEEKIEVQRATSKRDAMPIVCSSFPDTDQQAETIATIAAGPQKNRTRKSSRPRTATIGPLESIRQSFSVTRLRRLSSSTGIGFFASRQDTARPVDV